MRILLVNSFYYQRGGDCAQVLWLEDRLNARGHDVAVFAMQHPENLPNRWSGYWADNVEYRRSFSRTGAARAAARSVTSPQTAGRLARLLAIHRPDVVHLHAVHHHLTLSVMPVLERWGGRVVWTMHDYRAVCPSTHLLARGEPCERCRGGAFWRALPMRCKSDSLGRTAVAVAESYWSRLARRFACVDVVVCPSEFQAATFARMGLPVRRVRVLPNPLLVSGEQGGEKLRDGGALYVGRLSHEKGPAALLEVWAKLGDLPLTLVGDGPDEAPLRAAARRASLPVTFTGRLTAAEVAGRMRRAAVLCVPSVCYENCPGVVLEAMHFGLPVVAGDRGGLRELLDDGKCGWLVRPGDAAGWEAAVREAAAGGPRVDALVSAAARRVARRHDGERYLDTLTAVYTGQG